MPVDPHAFDEEDLGTDEARRRFDDFDCPSCDANNPYAEAFGSGDEILCYYCGQEFRVEVTGEGKLRLRPI